MRILNKPTLVKTDNGLCIVADGMSLKADFSHLFKRLQKNREESEAVVRACALKGAQKPVLFDMTAGLGEDSFLLAAAGFEVVMFESNDIIASLLEDALLRAAYIPETENIVSRMTLIRGDSTVEAAKYMKTSGIRPDVIYLDPMFPHRKKSGLIGKKFQLLQLLEEPCGNEAELLNAAEELHPVKIVIKRPAKAEALAKRKPTYVIWGNTIRYDCIYLG